MVWARHSSQRRVLPTQIVPSSVSCTEPFQKGGGVGTELSVLPPPSQGAVCQPLPWRQAFLGFAVRMELFLEYLHTFTPNTKVT